MSQPKPARLSPPPGHTGPLPVIPAEVHEASKRAAAEFRAQFGPNPRLEDLLDPDQIAAVFAALAVHPNARLAPAVVAIRTARQVAGLTVAEAATRAGVSEELLGRLEGGKVADPSWQTLDRCAAAVGLTLTLTASPAAGG